MPYLIDGHNLIAYLPDLDLADPDDEAKLVLKLRGFCAKYRKRCIVVFDHGLPGGQSTLSTPSVAVIFAAYERSNADAVLRERINNTKDFRGWIVVSSDQQVLDAAEQRGMRGMRSSEFANRLKNEPVEFDASTAANLRVPETEVTEWLQHFREPDAESSSSTRVTPRKDVPEEPTTPDAAPSRSRSELPPIHKSRVDDVDHWLNVFGDEDAERKPTDRAPKLRPRNAPPEAPKKTEAPVKRDKSGMPLFDGQQKEDAALSKNTVDAWMDFFGDVDNSRQPTDPAFQRDDPHKQGRYKNQDGKRAPIVHKRMATAVDLHLSSGEVDAWLDVFGYSEDTSDE
jgi:hypothetical protein